MSKTDRDQRGRPRSGKNRCTGCPSCGAGEYKQMHRRAERRQKHDRIAEELS